MRLIVFEEASATDYVSDGMEFLRQFLQIFFQILNV